VSARLLSGQQGLNRVRKEDCGTRQYGNGELKHGEHPEETDLYTELELAIICFGSVSLASEKWFCWSYNGT
jgi:hypothetical protein